jgi:hypothetical protein
LTLRKEVSPSRRSPSYWIRWVTATRHCLPDRRRGVRAAFGLVLRPEIAALSMSGSSLIVAVNALTLKRLPLPRRRSRNIHVARSLADPMPPFGLTALYTASVAN